MKSRIAAMFPLESNHFVHLQISVPTILLYLCLPSAQENFIYSPLPSELTMNGHSSIFTRGLPPPQTLRLPSAQWPPTPAMGAI